MNKKRKRAIDIVKGLMNSLEQKEYLDVENFKAKTESYLLIFLGSDNPIYLKVKRFDFSILINNRMDKYQRKSLFQDKILEFKEMLEDSVEFLTNNKLYQKPKKNWFSDYPNWKIASILFAFLVFGFGIGKWAERFEALKLNKNKNTSLLTDTITTYRPSVTISQIDRRSD